MEKEMNSLSEIIFQHIEEISELSNDHNTTGNPSGDNSSVIGEEKLPVFEERGEFNFEQGLEFNFSLSIDSRN